MLFLYWPNTILPYKMAAVEQETAVIRIIFSALRGLLDLWKSDFFIGDPSIKRFNAQAGETRFERSDCLEDT